MTLALTSENFETETKDSIVLIDFWAPWCGPCQTFGPIVDKVAGEYKGGIKIAKVDVNDQANLAIAQKYQVSSIPAIKIIQNGKEIWGHVGMMSEEELKKTLAEYENIA